MAYLEGIVDIIDVPSLKDVEITFDNPSLALPLFKGFIDRIEMHRSHRRAHILSSEPTISISLTQPGAPMRLKLQAFCKPSCIHHQEKPSGLTSDNLSIILLSKIMDR